MNNYKELITISHTSNMLKWQLAPEYDTMSKLPDNTAKPSDLLKGL